jgi:predicted metallo-beta-lactamase superfamily hydrolase
LLKKIKIIPIAAESLGVRSMCTLIETPDVKILLDAGISVCPYRFNLMPNPIEFQTLARLRKKIEKTAKQVEAVTISHYHFDHHTPSHEDWIVNWTSANLSADKIYGGKQVIVKSPYKNITKRQKKCANNFLKTGSKIAKKIEIADDKTFFWKIYVFKVFKSCFTWTRK